MKVFTCLAIILCLFSAGLSAEMMPVEPGSVDTYTSENGRYEVSIKYGEGFPSWSLKEDGIEVWSKPLTEEPGPIVVSDNGETIILTLWGWRDEGASSGVVIFDGKGEFARKVLFRDTSMSQETLRWVRATSVSADGKYFAVGGNGSESATVTLFDASTGDEVWDRSAGLPDMVAITLSPDGRYVLAATRGDKSSDMEFVLLDPSGEKVWSEKFENNLSYDVERYVRFTDSPAEFEVYDLAAASYTRRVVPEKGR